MRAGIVYTKIPVSAIQTSYISDDVSQLKESIRVYGLLQPIGVIRQSIGYKLIFGKRRLKACTELGLKYIHAVLLSFREDELKLINPIENLHRSYEPQIISYAEAFKGTDIKKLLCLSGTQAAEINNYYLLNDTAKKQVDANTLRFVSFAEGDSAYFLKMCQVEKNVPSLAKDKVRLSVLSDRRIFINEIEKILQLMRMGGYTDCVQEDEESIIIKKHSAG